MYDYGYDYGYTAESVVGAAGAMIGLSAAAFIFSAIISLIAIISYAKIFKKAGKPWWACIVPIYNVIVMLEIAKLPMWYIALFFVPIANIYALFKINIEIAKKFGKTSGFGIGMTLLSIIFIPLLAFSDNKYEDSIENTNVNTTNNQFDATNVINNSNSNISENLNNNISSIPVAPINIQTEATNNNGNAFNTEPTPVMNEPVQEPISVAEPVNVFNTEPTPIMNEPVQIESIAETNKKCKNCGNDLPNIVSICPNCGIDNE